MIYKIVQGNSFKLHILVQKVDVSREFQRLVDFDMRNASDVKVELVGCFQEDTSVPITVSGIQGNVLVCDIPSTLDIGNYGVKASWTYNGYNMSSIERNLLRIVTHNSKANIPTGILEGEHTGLFNLRYYIVTSNQSACPVTFITDNMKLTYEIDKDNDNTITIDSSQHVTEDSIANGSCLDVNMEPSEGYNIGLVRVVMNGVDVTGEYFDKETGKITIPAVSGYVVVTASGDSNVCYYGASAAKNISEFNLDDLKLTEGDLINKTITVTTTEEQPYVWFVSRVAVVFRQEDIKASMNSTHIGDLYYYWSDELIPGDSTYTIKLT